MRASDAGCPIHTTNSWKRLWRIRSHGSQFMSAKRLDGRKKSTNHHVMSECKQVPEAPPINGTRKIRYCQTWLPEKNVWMKYIVNGIANVSRISELKILAKRCTGWMSAPGIELEAETTWSAASVRMFPDHEKAIKTLDHNLCTTTVNCLASSLVQLSIFFDHVVNLALRNHSPCLQ